MTTQKTSGHRHPSPLAALVIVPVVVAIVLTLFAWPTARLEPRDLPVGVAGPPPAVGQLEQQLGANPDAFDVHRYANEAEARAAIEDREVYGAFVATPEGPKVLSSSAASPVVAQLLGQAAADTGASTEDVVTAEHGAALPSSVLPLVIAGILIGVAASLLTTSASGRVGLLVAGSAIIGLVAAGIVQSWLDVVEGDWIVNAGVLGLTVLAIGASVTGLYAWLGGVGIGVAAALMVFIGNPFSGAGSGARDAAAARRRDRSAAAARGGSEPAAQHRVLRRRRRRSAGGGPARLGARRSGARRPRSDAGAAAGRRPRFGGGVSAREADAEHDHSEPGGTYLLAVNTAPCGSRRTVKRTKGASMGGASTVPPSSVAFAAAASASSTAKVTLQCGGASGAFPLSGISQATTSSKPAGAPWSAMRPRRPGSSFSR